MHEVMVATCQFHWQVACLDVRLRIGLASSSPGGERMRSDLLRAGWKGWGRHLGGLQSILFFFNEVE
jgi:hypothetical protein